MTTILNNNDNGKRSVRIIAVISMTINTIMEMAMCIITNRNQKKRLFTKLIWINTCDDTFMVKDENDHSSMNDSDNDMDLKKIKITKESEIKLW